MWSSFRKNPHNCILPLERKCNDTNIIKQHLGGLIWGTAILDDNDNIYVGSTNKRFYCLDSKGKQLWKYRIKNINDALIDSAGALHPLGYVVIPGGDGHLHAVDVKTGKPIWIFSNKENSKHTTGEIVNSYEGNVQIDEDGMIYAGCDNDYMYCLNGRGEFQWMYKTDMMIWTCAAISQTTCYFGSLDFCIYAVNKFTGLLKAKVNTGSEIKSSPIIYNNHVFIGNTNGIVFCYTIDLKEVWRKDIGRNLYATPVIFENTIIYINLNGNICSLNIEDGSVVWSTQLFSNVCSSPIVINNKLIVGTNLCKLVAIDVRNGELVGCISLNKKDVKKAINASLIVNSKGQIIVGSYDGHMYFVPCDFWKNNNNVSLTSIADLRLHKPVYLDKYRDNTHIISIKLVVLGSPNAAICYSSISITPKIPYQYEISADGTFLNLIPLSNNWSYLNKTYTIKVKGSYYLQTENWIFDRFKYDVNFFEDTVTFNTPITHEDSELPREINISDMYLMQPQVLDTYIPAAFDAQGWRVVILDSTNLVMLSCIPDIEDDFIVTSKTVHMTYEKYKNIIKVYSKAFEISAMGGTIPSKKFVAYMSIHGDKVIGEFWALSNCLEIKGNGKNYKFSSDIVNQIADIFLQVQSIGSFSGKITK